MSGGPERWTGPEALRAQVQRLWESGRLLAAGLTGEPLFPLELRMRGPGGAELARHYDAARDWVSLLQEGERAGGYVLAWEEVQTRQLGRQRLPCGARVLSEAEALRWLRRTREAERFRALAVETLARFPALRDWVLQRPLRLLEHEADWPAVMAVLAWFQAHPRAGLYLRQLDIEGVDTKFIEGLAGLFTELLERVLPPEAWEPGTPRRAFAARFGLRDKPVQVRLRLLDPALHVQGLTDLTVPVTELAQWAPATERVFITENEVNGLSFPQVPGALVIFGLGYSLERLSELPWLHSREVHYWGDLDTHGFAMLDRLRSAFAQARSLLMDRETLLGHRAFWVEEPEPHRGTLTRLTEPEAALYEDLQRDRLGQRVRLEQERIRFGALQRALAELS